MEIEKSPQEIAKKLWKIVRIVFHMMREAIGKRKITFDLHMLLKRGKIAGKAITKLLRHHHHSYYSALTCRSGDVNSSFVSPREYEFSCSNTPVYRRRRRRQAEELYIAHKVFDILTGRDAVEASPLAVALPGFGCSPVARQLRVSDSPFSVKDGEEEEDHQVDEDAEEFIRKFYKDLKKQKRVESPLPYLLRMG